MNKSTFNKELRESITGIIYKYRIDTSCTNRHHLHHSGYTFNEIVDDYIFFYDIDYNILKSVPIHIKKQFELFHQDYINCGYTKLVRLTKDEHKRIHKKWK